MESLIAGFSAQLREAVSIGRSAKLVQDTKAYKNIVLLGIGGSAFGGEIVKNYIAKDCRIPFMINRDYTIPGFVGSDSLVITSSYSGNTEETLTGFETCLERGVKPVCISSGGRLIEKARESGFEYIVLPEGYPPRTAAGFSIVQQLYILRAKGQIGDFEDDLEEGISLIESFDEHDLAREIANEMKGRFPILYSGPDFESVSIRWRQQIEENGKQLAFHHVVPEMNHNELVGWEFPVNLLKNTAVYFFESPLDHPRNKIRMGINKGIIENLAGVMRTIVPKGKGMLGQAFYLLHLGDWVSYYLSEVNQVNPIPVKVIDFLKSELAKH